MRKRKIGMTQILAAGVLSPALSGLPHPAAAYTADVPRDMELTSTQGGAGQSRLEKVFYCLSPSGKCAILGWRSCDDKQWRRFVQAPVASPQLTNAMDSVLSGANTGGPVSNAGSQPQHHGKIAVLPPPKVPTPKVNIPTPKVK